MCQCAVHKKCHDKILGKCPGSGKDSQNTIVRYCEPFLFLSFSFSLLNNIYVWWIVGVSVSIHHHHTPPSSLSPSVPPESWSSEWVRMVDTRKRKREKETTKHPACAILFKCLSLYYLGHSFILRIQLKSLYPICNFISYWPFLSKV